MADIDDLFTATMNAPETPAVKRALAVRYIEIASENQSLDSSLRMMECTINLITNSKDKLLIELSQSVFDAWAVKDDHLEAFFTAERVSALLQNVCQNPVKVISLLAPVLKRLKSSNSYEDLCRAIAKNAAGFVQQNPSYEALMALSCFIRVFSKALPTGQRLSYFCMSLIKGISRFKPPEKVEEIVNYTTFVPNVFGKLLFESWEIGGDYLRRMCLETVFELISAPTSTDSKLSLALGAVMQVFPSALVEAAIDQITSETFVSDGILFNTLVHMIDWLAWPNIQNISKWTIYFLRRLDLVERHALLDKITMESIDKIVDRLKVPMKRKSNFEVLEFMLRGCQHSKIPFIKLLPKISVIYLAVVKEPLENNREFFSHFSDVLKCLMRLHGGPDQLFAPIRRLIGEEPLPDRVFEKFKESAWQKGNGSRRISYAREIQKIFPDKTGLENDHNTCYLNSVIQALYMCDSLVERFLTATFPVEAAVLSSVQLLFAFLRFSKRSAINCEWFEKKATPSSFVRGNQEDASELYNHLIDSLMEQEKLLSGEHFVSKGFYGLQKCTNRCLSCYNEVSRTIPFAELSLHFKKTSTSKQMVSCAAGGGDKQCSSNACSNEKSNDADSLVLEDMLMHYFETEQLEDDCKYYCENCLCDRNGERLVSLLATPEYLRITLNRFTYSDFVSCKIMTEVEIPRTVTLPVQQETDRLTDVFCLFAVVVHCGRNTNSGHYYCIARHPKVIDESLVTELDVMTLSGDSDFFNDSWFKFDDETISRSSFDELSTRFGRTPYILLYRKITGVSLDCREGGLNALELRVPRHVLELVEKDNRKYYEEVEAKRRLFSAYDVAASKSHRWNKDDDEDDNPQTSNKFDEPPRLVF